MPKKIKRYLNLCLYTIDETEAWFCEMSKRGNHLLKIGHLNATFVKGEPADVYYKIEFIKEDKVLEVKKIYEDSGFESVSIKSKQFIVFRSKENLEIKENEKIIQIKKETMNETIKQLKFSFKVLNIAYIPMFLIMIWLILRLGFYMNMVTNTQITQTILMFSLIYTYFATKKSYEESLKIKKELEGKVIGKKNINVKKKRMSTNISVAIYLAFIIPTFVMIGADLNNSINRKNITLTKESDKLPIIRLSEIETDKTLVVNKEGYYNPEYENYYTYDESVLVPFQLKSDELLTSTILKWEDNSGYYSPSIKTETYKTFKIFSKGLAKSLIEGE